MRYQLKYKNNTTITTINVTITHIIFSNFKLIEAYFQFSTLPNYYVGFGKNSWAVTLLVV